MAWLCCARERESVRTLDYRHCALTKLPGAVANSERTLEELYLDSNQIKSLPRELFACDNLRKLTLSDNDVETLPPSVCNLVRLEELDISKNGILELPEDIKGCKSLRSFEGSVNPLGRLPDGFTQLLNLTSVYLNDAFLEYLPGSFGRLSRLKILELRENRLKTLPMSLGRLTELERLDIGNNEFVELPDVIGSLASLLELWCDSNQIVALPDTIGNLKQLLYLDASKNRISSLGDRIDGCSSLSDFHLSMNLLQQLPQSIGRLSNLTTLKVNDNRLTSLPASVGGLVALSELDVTANDLEELPPTIGLLRHLRTLIADENFLVDIPPELGSCSALTVLSARSNKLTYLPDEIGRVHRLRVLNVSDNELRCLPCSLVNLRELQALWLAENQAKPLIRLQPETDSLTGKRSLTCYLLPQQRTDAKTYAGDDETSFRASVWDEQRQLRQQIRFDSFPDQNGERPPVNYPKERATAGRHEQNMAVLKKAANGTATSVDPHDEPDALASTAAIDELPRTTPHRLLKLERERLAKEKARINNRRFSGAGSGDDIEQRDGSVPLMSTTALRGAESVGKIPDRGMELTAGMHATGYQQQGAAHDGSASLHAAGLFGMPSGGGVPTGSAAGLASASRSSLLSAAAARGDKDEPRGDGTTSAEDHFGVFLSEENPELYRQRFQYYKRVRQSRRSGEAASDLGYYGQGAAAAASVAGSHRHQRPPLMAGLDGSSNEWDAQTSRSTGDGYASDLDGYNGRQRQGRHHHQAAAAATARTGHHHQQHPRHNRHHQRDMTPMAPPSEADEGAGATPISSSAASLGRSRRSMERLSETSPSSTAAGLPGGLAAVPTRRPPILAPGSSGRSSNTPARLSGSAAGVVQQAPKTPSHLGHRTTASPGGDNGVLSQRDYAAIAKELEGSPFPPPPPYKPPVRDLHPDGASNEGGDLAKSQASLEGAFNSGGGNEQFKAPLPSNAGGVVSASVTGRLAAPQVRRPAAAVGDYVRLPAAATAGGSAASQPAAVAPAAAPRERRSSGGSGWPDFISSSTPCQEVLLTAASAASGGMVNGNGHSASHVSVPPAPPSDGWPSPVRTVPEQQQRRTPMPAVPQAPPSAVAAAVARSLAFHDNRTFYGELTSRRLAKVGSDWAAAAPASQCCFSTAADADAAAINLASVPGSWSTAHCSDGSRSGDSAGGRLTNVCAFSHANGYGCGGGGGSSGSGFWTHTPAESAFSSPRARSAAAPAIQESTPQSPYALSLADPSGGRNPQVDASVPRPPAASDLPASGGGWSPHAVSGTALPGGGGCRPLPQPAAATAAAVGGSSDRLSSLAKPPAPPQPEPLSSRSSNGHRGHSPPANVDILTFSIALAKNAELGFSIAGGIGSQGNPFRLLDKGIFVSKVSTFGPAANILQPGDKILEVNGVDFSETEHHQAVSLLKSLNQSLTITVERMQPTTV